jgi:hypothetical protein
LPSKYRSKVAVLERSGIPAKTTDNRQLITGNSAEGALAAKKGEKNV